MSGLPIFSNATLDDTDTNKPIYSSMESKKLEYYAPVYSSIGVNNGKIEVTFDKDLATIASFDANSFVVKDSGSTYTVNEVTISNKKVTIGTNHTHTSSNNLTLEYTKPADLTKAIKTTDGIELEELKIIDNVNQTGQFPKPTTIVANDYDGGKKELELTFNELVEGSISSDDFVVKTTSDNTVHQPLIVNVTNDKVVLRKGTITRKGLVDGTLTGADSSWSDGTRDYTSSSNHGGYYPYKAFEDVLGTNIWHSTNKYSSGNASASAGDTLLEDISTTTTYDIINWAAGEYKFIGGEFTSRVSNPSLTLLRGKTYEFDVNASGHPFRINTANTTGTGSEYSSVTPYDLVSSNSTLSGQVYSGSSFLSATHPVSGAFNGVTSTENSGAWISASDTYSNGTPNTNSSTNGYDGEWVQVDVGQIVTATTFKFYTRNVSNRDDNDAKKMRLFSSNDGNTWTQVYDWTNLTTLDWRTGTGGTPIALTFDKTIRGRYFRIAIGELIGTATFTQLSEFEVIGITSGVINNGADNGTVTFTIPSNAPNTLYYNCEHHSAMSGQITITDPANYKGEWLQVDLGSSTTLNSFEILPRPYDQFKPKDFKLFGKVNETDNWTEIYEVTGLTATDWKTGTTHHSAGNWDINFTGRYFRLAINKVVTGSYVCVGELILNSIVYNTLPSDPSTLTISYAKNTNANQNLKVKGTTTALDSFLYRNGNHIKSFTVGSPIRPSAVDLIKNDGTSHNQDRGDLNKIIDNNDSSFSYTTKSNQLTGVEFVTVFDFPTSLIGKKLNSIKWKWATAETGTLNAKFGIRSGNTNTSLNVTGVSNIGSGTFNTGLVSTWDNLTDWHIDTAVANDNATVIFDGEYTIQSGDKFLFNWLNSGNYKHFTMYNMFFITENAIGAPSIVDTTSITFNKLISGSDSYDKNDFIIKQGNNTLAIDQINISSGKLLITTTTAITDINTVDVVYKKNSNAIKHLKDNNNKKINSFRIKNGNDIKPLIFTFNQTIAANTNIDKNDFLLRVDGVVKNIHDVIVMEEGTLLIRPEETVTDINKTMITYTKSATANKNIANANGDAVISFTYHTVNISKKTEGTNEILQVSGSLPGTTSGGSANTGKRTIYVNNSDTNNTPSYTGSDWPYVKISDYKTLNIDSNITATITIHNNILLVNGRPAHQYTNDSNASSATGDSVDDSILSTAQLLYENFEDNAYTGNVTTATIVSGGYNSSNYALQGGGKNNYNRWGINTTTYQSVSFWYYRDSANSGSSMESVFDNNRQTNGINSLFFKNVVGHSEEDKISFMSSSSAVSKLYVNGVDQSSAITTSWESSYTPITYADLTWHHFYIEFSSATNMPATFGQPDDGGSTYSSQYDQWGGGGKFDEVRFFNQALSASDISNLASGGNVTASNVFYFFTSSGQNKKTIDDLETEAASSGVAANDIDIVKNKVINNDGDIITLTLNQPLKNITTLVEKRQKRHAVLKLLFSSNPMRKQFKVTKEELALNDKIVKTNVMVIKSGETVNLSNNSPLDNDTAVYANLSSINDTVVFNTGANNITFTKLANNEYSVVGYNNSTIITRTGENGNWKDGDSTTFDGMTYYFGGISTNGTDDTPGEDFVATTVTISSEKDGSSGLLNHLTKRTASMNSNTTQKEIKKHKRNFSSSDYLLYKKLRHFKK